MKKIILTTVGSLGDLHPFIAIALALKQRGLHPVLGVPEDFVSKTQAAGLEAFAVMPASETILARMELTPEAAVQRLIDDRNFLLESTILPWLAETARALDAEADGARAIIGSALTFAAPIIAEKHNIPFIPAVLQPASLYSAYDPPRIPDFRLMRSPPMGALGLGWNRLFYALIRRWLRRRYTHGIDALRAAYGLAPANQAILLDPERNTAFNLGCYSALFAPLPPDAPPRTLLAGFPHFDSFSGRSEMLEPALESFLAAGQPPIVFTLGSVMVHAAGAFYARAAEIASRLGQRAVLLTGTEVSATRPRDDIFVTQYAPHSTLFSRAAAIVHHGGVGTTGQALRAGIPQLVVPHMLDQFDNGSRIARLGVGASLTAKKFSVPAAQAQLAYLLQNPRTSKQAARLGALLQTENGAQAAAAAIEAAI